MVKQEHELRIYAHRGSSRLFPENTISAFQQALKDGATHLEMDVRITSDGHIIVSHDADGRRLAGRNRRIADSPLSEVQSWDMGRLFRDYNGNLPRGGSYFRIPTLWEILKTFRGVPLNIDIKDHHPFVVRAVIELVRLHNAEFHVQLCSFNSKVVSWARQIKYGGSISSSRREVIALKLLPSMLHRYYKFDGDAFQVPSNNSLVRLGIKKLIKDSHKLGKRIDFWVVNDPEDAFRLLEWGADGLVTDDLAAIVPVVHQFARLRERPLAVNKLRGGKT